MPRMRSATMKKRRAPMSRVDTLYEPNSSEASLEDTVQLEDMKMPARSSRKPIVHNGDDDFEPLPAAFENTMPRQARYFDESLGTDARSNTTATSDDFLSIMMKSPMPPSPLVDRNVVNNFFTQQQQRRQKQPPRDNKTPRTDPALVFPPLSTVVVTPPNKGSADSQDSSITNSSTTSSLTIVEHDKKNKKAARELFTTPQKCKKRKAVMDTLARKRRKEKKVDVWDSLAHFSAPAKVQKCRSSIKQTRQKEEKVAIRRNIAKALEVDQISWRSSSCHDSLSNATSATMPMTTSGSSGNGSFGTTESSAVKQRTTKKQPAAAVTPVPVQRKRGRPKSCSARKTKNATSVIRSTLVVRPTPKAKQAPPKCAPRHTPTKRSQPKQAPTSTKRAASKQTPISSPKRKSTPKQTKRPRKQSIQATRPTRDPNLALARPHHRDDTVLGKEGGFIIKRCGTCFGCQVLFDCNECDSCLASASSSSTDTKAVTCQLRSCLQPFRVRESAIIQNSDPQPHYTKQPQKQQQSRKSVESLAALSSPRQRKKNNASLNHVLQPSFDDDDAALSDLEDDWSGRDNNSNSKSAASNESEEDEFMDIPHVGSGSVSEPVVNMYQFHSPFDDEEEDEQEKELENDLNSLSSTESSGLHLSRPIMYTNV